MPELATAPRTVREAIAFGSESLAAAGSDTPRLDAELLLAAALGHGSRARLVLDSEEDIDHAGLADYERLLARRQRREPVAYILGHKWFRGICLRVDGRVLIPRPETELLVEVALSLPRGARVADVGTGCGAVALALALERPDLTVTGIDSSEDALVVAAENRDRLGVEVTFVCTDLLDNGAYDAVVANLPYVADAAELAPEIALFEPREALYAGSDGLDSLRRLATAVGARPGIRFAALEVGAGQGEMVGELLRRVGLDTIRIHRDLADHERVVVGRR
ncbi:MAG TPA: peptide chain release factor N(5)-glutamine methyltransferase [Solirubrobacteraceae bacterium]|nr:peptide chain release factor N(5)-glutamine methyltransferase [Solirubrobacteraceae bacterium]